jgi:hypothetical protein
MHRDEVRKLALKKNRRAQEREAEALGVTLRVLNEGAHWEWSREGLRLEWWPETGRIAVNKVCDRHGRRCRTYQEALAWVGEMASGRDRTT